MTHRERAICVLEKRQPDYVPHFEIEFQETERNFEGRSFFGIRGEPDRTGLSAREMNLHNAPLKGGYCKKV